MKTERILSVYGGDMARLFIRYIMDEGDASRSLNGNKGDSVRMYIGCKALRSLYRESINFVWTTDIKGRGTDREHLVYRLEWGIWKIHNDSSSLITLALYI